MGADTAIDFLRQTSTDHFRDIPAHCIDRDTKGSLQFFHADKPVLVNIPCHFVNPPGFHASTALLYILIRYEKIAVILARYCGIVKILIKI